MTMPQAAVQLFYDLYDREVECLQKMIRDINSSNFDLRTTEMMKVGIQQERERIGNIFQEFREWINPHG